MDNTAIRELVNTYYTERSEYIEKAIQTAEPFFVNGTLEAMHTDLMTESEGLHAEPELKEAADKMQTMKNSSEAAHLYYETMKNHMLHEITLSEKYGMPEMAENVFVRMENMAYRKGWSDPVDFADGQYLQKFRDMAWQIRHDSKEPVRDAAKGLKEQKKAVSKDQSIER